MPEQVTLQQNMYSEYHAVLKLTILFIHSDHMIKNISPILNWIRLWNWLVSLFESACFSTISPAEPI